MTGIEKVAASFHRPDRALDLPMLRHELECASMLTLPDLTHELVCQREEIPGMHFWGERTLPTDWQVGRLMATCFEAGRRYGLLSAIAFCSPDTITTDEPTTEQVQRRYGNISSMAQAEALSEFDRIFDKTLRVLETFGPEAKNGDSEASHRLARLERDEPGLYAALVRATFPELVDASKPATGTPRGHCQRTAATE